MSILDNLLGRDKKKAVKKGKAKKTSKGKTPDLINTEPKPPLQEPTFTDEEKVENEALAKEIKDDNEKDKRGLTRRELLFIKFHLMTLTKESAAIQAGYSPKSASACATRLLKRPAIKKELNKRIKGLVSRTDEKIAKVIEHLYVCAFYDPKDIINEHGAFIKPLEDLGNLSYAVEGIETKLNAKGDSYRLIKLANRTKARDQLGKYLQMFTDKIELTGGLTLNIGKPPEPEKVNNELMSDLPDILGNDKTE